MMGSAKWFHGLRVLHLVSRKIALAESVDRALGSIDYPGRLWLILEAYMYN